MRQTCSKCSEEWLVDSYPVCPKCNTALIEAIQEVDKTWLNDPNRQPNDVLNVDVKSTHLHVYITDLYTGKVKTEYKAYANPGEEPYA